MGLWLTEQEILALPKSGAGWDAVKAAAAGSWGAAKVSDQDSKHDTRTLAGALVAVATNDAALKTKTKAALNAAIGTEAGGRTLALGRNLPCYVIAASIVNHRDPAFVAWVDGVRKKSLDGMTLIQCHGKRGNNWGTMAGAARIAADLYLDDQTDLAAAIKVFKGWLGDRAQYAGFDWGDLDWQADKTKPVGINPAGAHLNGKNVDGCLPDDQRRTGGFAWPPPCGNYPAGALGPIYVTVELLRRNGYPDAPTWSDSAPLRAAKWRTGTVDGKTACTFGGDDAWQPFLINAIYGSAIPGGAAGAEGKPMAWTGWTHAKAGVTPPPPDPDPDPDPPPPPGPTPLEQAHTLGLAISTAATLAAAKADAQKVLDL